MTFGPRRPRKPLRPSRGNGALCSGFLEEEGEFQEAAWVPRSRQKPLGEPLDFVGSSRSRRLIRLLSGLCCCTNTAACSQAAGSGACQPHVPANVEEIRRRRVTSRLA